MALQSVTARDLKLMILSVEDVYKLLEDKFPSYHDLCRIPVVDNGERLVPLKGTGIHHHCFDDRMRKYTGEDVYLREGLVSKLQAAQSYLNEALPGHILEVAYGYRHLFIQTESFEAVKEKLVSQKPSGWTEDALKEAASHSIAVPDVAGHPTGGAVDVFVKNPEGTQLDMGTGFHEFTKNSYVYSPFVSKKVWFNRQKLRQSMTSAGFAPFDGEWWHFSYGDKEWAYFYGKPNSIYDQVQMDQ